MINKMLPLKICLFGYFLWFQRARQILLPPWQLASLPRGGSTHPKSTPAARASTLCTRTPQPRMAVTMAADLLVFTHAKIHLFCYRRNLWRHNNKTERQRLRLLCASKWIRRRLLRARLLVLSRRVCVAAKADC
jgi:hypothetical protein